MNKQLDGTKKTILHVIEYMGRGGAEVMLVKLLKELSEYNNIVVALNPQNHFTQQEFNTQNNYYSLNMGSFSRFPLAVYKLNRFIKKHNIHLVHSHLFTATLVARLAVPQNIPLITTIHTDVSASGEYKKWYIRLLEKIGYNFHKSTIVGVSKTVLQHYFNHFNHKPRQKELLYTFVDTHDTGSENTSVQKQENVFRLIAIGALRYPKNQQYLVKAFEKLKNTNVELHIYGTGRQADELARLITDTNVKVILKGEVKNASRLIPQYNAFVMSSEFEGFSLSVLEAMCMQVPMLLSDIPSFREQCEDSALFFNLKNVDDFVNKLHLLMSDENMQQQLAAKARQRVLNNFTMQHHLSGLRNIYTKALNS
jgi:glycosyltransferase involved in cell wall biosynthesis